MPPSSTPPSTTLRTNLLPTDPPPRPTPTTNQLSHPTTISRPEITIRNPTFLQPSSTQFPRQSPPIPSTTPPLQSFNLHNTQLQYPPHNIPNPNPMHSLDLTSTTPIKTTAAPLSTGLHKKRPSPTPHNNPGEVVGRVTTSKEGVLKSSMTVQQIRDELKVMGLSTHGRKEELLQKLIAGRNKSVRQQQRFGGGGGGGGVAGSKGSKRGFGRAGDAGGVAFKGLGRGRGEGVRKGGGVGSVGKQVVRSGSGSGSGIAGKKRRIVSSGGLELRAGAAVASGSSRENKGNVVPEYVDKNVVMAYMYYLCKAHPTINDVLSSVEASRETGVETPTKRRKVSARRSTGVNSPSGLARDMAELRDLFRMHDDNSRASIGQRTDAQGNTNNNSGGIMSSATLQANGKKGLWAAKAGKLRAERLEILLRVEDRIRQSLNQPENNAGELTTRRLRLQNVSKEIDSLLSVKSTLEQHPRQNAR